MWRVLYLGILIGVSLAGHLALQAWEPGRTPAKEQPPLTVSVPATLPASKVAEKKAKPAGNQANGGRPERAPETPYHLGAHRQNHQPVIHLAGTVEMEQMPDAVFEYGGQWRHIAKELNREIDLLFSPYDDKIIEVLGMDEHGSLYRVHANMSLRDFLKSHPDYHRQVAKNRKAEFDQAPELAVIYRELKRKLYPDVDDADLRFIGLLPRHHVAELAAQVARLQPGEQSKLEHVRVVYRLTEGDVRMEVKPLD